MIIINNIKCHCCGFYTVENKVVSDICPVCFWQKDIYQEKHIDDNGGPNLVSLREAKENFHKFGAIEEQFKNFVRLPLKEEMDE